MNIEYPLVIVSVIMPTYNRAKTIERAINSVLNQSYAKIELIIIDDGSSDNTSEILNRFNDPGIRIFKHEKNKGVTAAKNTGLNNIHGEWFTILDSDDEIVPDAIETMISIPLYFDKSITAVTCNCLDTSENEFAGKGLTKDQYLDVETLMTIWIFRYNKN
jgi:glycosyltransferase involved in cell wall biosynthesis